MKTDVKKIQGFTLLEVIVVLVLVGIMSTFAGMGIVKGVEGYIFASNNSSMTQKAQMALSRLTQEMTTISDVTIAGGTGIAFTGPRGDRAIGLSGSTIKVEEAATLTTGDILVDNVANGGFTLTYSKSNGSAWVLGTDPINLLARIDIVLRLARQDVSGGYLEFSTSVNPRNTGNPNAPVAG